MRDAVERDRVRYGEARAVKLDRESAREIFLRYHAGESIARLAAEFGISSSATIYNIARRRLWARDTADLSCSDIDKTQRQLRGDAHPMSKVDTRIVAEIRQRVSDGESRIEMCREYGLSKSQIQRIVTGASW